MNSILENFILCFNYPSNIRIVSSDEAVFEVTKQKALKMLTETDLAFQRTNIFR